MLLMDYKVWSRLTTRKTVFQGSSGILLTILSDTCFYYFVAITLVISDKINILCSILKDNTISDESLRLLQGVRNVILASLSACRRHERERVVDDEKIRLETC